jgi:hypothetical protein
LDEEAEALIRSRRPPHELPALAPDGSGVEPKDARRPAARLRLRLNRLYLEDVVPLPNGEHEERPAIEPKKPAH